MGDNSTSTCGYDIYIGYTGVVLSVFVIFDSVLTMVTIWRTRDLHTNQYIFIASLAVADIMMSLIFLAIAGIHLTWIHSFVDGMNIVNNLVYGLQFSFIVLAGAHNSIIAVDRYIRIAHPFYYIQHMTKQRTIKILSLPYVLSFIIGCIPAFVYQDSKVNFCINIHQPLEYFYSHITILTINMCVVFGCYFKIARIAINHKKAAMSRRQQTGELAGNAVSRSNRFAVMKSVRFFVAMFGVYFTLTLPPFVMTNVSAYYNLPDVTVVIVSHFFLLHSVLNFVICCSMNQGFYKALKRTFADLKTCCFSKCQGRSL